MRYISLVLSLVLFVSTSLFAQEERSLEETLQALSQDAAKSYLAPIASGYGANLNAGWFHKAPQPEKFGFDLEIGLVGMAAQFPKSADHFSTSGEFWFSETEARTILERASANFNSLPTNVQNDLIQSLTQQPLIVKMEGATVVGSKKDKITISYGDFTVEDPNGINDITVAADEQELGIGGYLEDYKVLPLAAPQLTFGTIFGTAATIRYLPNVKLNGDLGEFSYFGFGLQHNPAAWLPIEMPLDVSAGFFTQNLKIGSLFKSSAVAFGLNASKQFGLDALNITPYAGFMLESSKLQVTYDFIVESPAGQSIHKIDFELEGKNSTRLTLGLSIRFLIININADYNIGQYNNFSAGINFAI